MFLFLFSLKEQTHVRSCFMAPGHSDLFSAALVKQDQREESRVAILRAALSSRHAARGRSACVIAGSSRPWRQQLE